MNFFLRTLHRWLGFPLGLLFVVTFGTGFLTAIEELLSHTGNSGYHYRETSIGEAAQALTLVTRGKQNIRQVIMPTPATPYYQVRLRGERFTYAIDDLTQASYDKRKEGGFFRTVLQLHRNFLLGREGFLGVAGKYYVAWVGLIALFLSLLGLWLWWPFRKTFTLKDMVPRGRKRKYFYYSHMTGGVITLIAILMLALTGASISYRAIAKKLLGVEENKEVQQLAIPLERNWQAWLTAAHAEMPEATLTQIRFPRQQRKPKGTNIKNNTEPTTPENNQLKQSRSENKKQQNLASSTALKKKPQLLEFRFHAAGDWLGIANSKVRIDKKTSTLVSVTAFGDLSLGEKIYSVLVPLHTGRNLPAVYVLVLLIFSLIGTIMVFSGLVSFVCKKRRWIQWANIILLLKRRDVNV